MAASLEPKKKAAKCAECVLRAASWKPRFSGQLEATGGICQGFGTLSSPLLDLGF